MYRIPSDLANQAQTSPQYWWPEEKLEVVLLQREGNLRAFESLCPHMGARMNVDEKSQRLVCPWHGLDLNLPDCRKAPSDARELRIEKRDGEYWLDV